jgi:AcrR family transcriptional regulator
MRKTGEQRKREIIKATLELASNQGVARVTTQAIADKVGIAHATVFRHFKSRDEIFAAALEHIVQRMMANLEPWFESSKPVDQRLRCLIEAQFLFFSGNRGLPRLLFSDRLHLESSELKHVIQQAMSHFTSRIEGLLLEGVEAGLFRGDLVSKDTARYLIALFQGLMMRWSVYDFEFSIEKEGQQLWRFFEPAIRAN